MKEFALWKVSSFNPIALRKTKIAYNFGLSECNRVKVEPLQSQKMTSFEKVVENMLVYPLTLKYLKMSVVNPVAHRVTKTPQSFGGSECSRV